MNVYTIFVWVVGAIYLLMNQSYAVDSQPAVQKPDVKVEKKGENEKSDTYNFYFQKAPSTNKVKQGETQEVEQTEPAKGKKDMDALAAESSTEPKAYKKPFDPTADLFVGAIIIPDRSAYGLTVGAHVYTKSIIGFRLGLFAAGGEYSDNDSTYFSAYGLGSNSGRNSLYGGDLGMSLDFIKKSKVRVALLAGAHIVSDVFTRKSKIFSAYGYSDSSGSTSLLSFNPYLGVSGTYYFTDRVGANVSVLVPRRVAYSSISLNLAFNI